MAKSNAKALKKEIKNRKAKIAKQEGKNNLRKPSNRRCVWPQRYSPCGYYSFCLLGLTLKETA